LPHDSEIMEVQRVGEMEMADDDIFHPFEGDDQMMATPLVKMGKSRFHVSGLVHDESGFPIGSPSDSSRLLRRLDNKIRLHSDEIVMYDEYMTEDAEILVLAYGSVARSAINAVKMAREDKINVGLFKPVTIWPFPSTRLRQLLKRVSAVIVAEMNLGQILYEVSRLNKRGAKIEHLSKVDGELITPQEVLDAISRVKSEIMDL